MRVLVTGGAGFIGSNLVSGLLDAGHTPGVIDDMSTGKSANLFEGVWFRRLDILDAAFGDAVAEFEPDVVVHLAAQASVSASFTDPARNHAVNVDGTRCVARAARAAGVRRLLSASSAAVYGEPAEIPLTEVSPKAPTNPYGDSKLTGELVLIEELAGCETDFASFRFSNVYGPRQDAAGEGGVVSVFSDRMAAGAGIVIDGDGTQTRDFIFVGDIVLAIAEALGSPERLAVEGVDGPAYNLSTGTEVSVLDLADRLATASGSSSTISHGPAREGDVARSVLDPGKAREVFGWRAHTPLTDGLATTVRWFATQAR